VHLVPKVANHLEITKGITEIKNAPQMGNEPPKTHNYPHIWSTKTIRQMV